MLHYLAELRPFIPFICLQLRVALKVMRAHSHTVLLAMVGQLRQRLHVNTTASRMIACWRPAVSFRSLRGNLRAKFTVAPSGDHFVDLHFPATDMREISET